MNKITESFNAARTALTNTITEAEMPFYGKRDKMGVEAKGLHVDPKELSSNEKIDPETGLANTSRRLPSVEFDNMSDTERKELFEKGLKSAIASSDPIAAFKDVTKNIKNYAGAWMHTVDKDLLFQIFEKMLPKFNDQNVYNFLNGLTYGTNTMPEFVLGKDYKNIDKTKDIENPTILWNILTYIKGDTSPAGKRTLKEISEGKYSWLNIK